MSASDTPITPTPPAVSPAAPAAATLLSIPQAAELPRLDGRAWLGLLLTFALLLVGWWTTLGEMWMRWFPAWERHGLTLAQRLTEGDSYYTHGPMVPLASLVIAFLIYKRVGVPCSRLVPSWLAGTALAVGSALLGLIAIAGYKSSLFQWAAPVLALLSLVGIAGSVILLRRPQREISSIVMGGAVVLTFLALHLASMHARVSFVSGFALIGVLLGLLLIWGGWPLLRAYWLPVVFLAFMVPLPMDWIAKLNFELKFLAGRAALGLTTQVFGVPAIMDGSFVYLPPGPDGAPKVLVVENVCSGLRSLISLICFASLFALICRTRGAWRLVMLAMAVPVAIAGNIARITTLNLVAHHVSVEAAGPESWFHTFSGLAVFALALAMLFGLEQAILWLGRLLRRDWADPRLLGFLDHLRPGGAAPATLRPLALGALALAAGLSLWWSAQPPLVHRSDTARRAVPTALHLGATAYDHFDIELDARTLTILETDDYLFRRFSSPESPAAPVDLLIVFSANNRKGTHPPEVCLEGEGQQIVDKRLQELPLPRVGTLVARELVAQQGQQRTYFLYVYKCGEAYTPSFLTQQARIAWNGLTHGNAAGALIRFSTPVNGPDLEAARALTLASAAALMPAIDERLP